MLSTRDGPLRKNDGMLNRTPVTSSNLVSIGYSDIDQILEVEFRHGGLYQYFQVPRTVFDGLMAAQHAGQSVGRYFDRHVKKNGFRYQEL